MTREVIDNFEDHLNSIRTEWHALKEKWFHGEMIDPVFEGVVRDFCVFDEAMHNIYQKVGTFMRGVEQLATGLVSLSEGVSDGLAHAHAHQLDHQIISDSTKMKEATNQIARSDAPHSAIAKLRRDMQFNILSPVQNHIVNNRNLKVSLDIRRRRLIELNSAKKQYDDIVKSNRSNTDRRFLQAQSNFESAKMTFTDVDRHVFEWLYILEEYRGDILDSTLQTLKYLQYEFFATSAHAISTSLPSRMEFRPMVEMTPEHLEAQVEMELQESEEQQLGEDVTEGQPAGKVVADFSARLIDKKARDTPGAEIPNIPVDPLSLSSLLSQGFEEGPARRALRIHKNDTQAALDWLINGGTEETVKRSKEPPDGVRMPTTVKRVQKLKAMRKAQQEKLRRRDAGESDSPRGSGTKDRERERDRDRSRRDSRDSRASRDSGTTADRDSDSEDEEEEAKKAKPRKSNKKAPLAAPEDLMDIPNDVAEVPKRSAPAASMDLLSMDDEKPAIPTDFSQRVEITALPQHLSFDLTRCEKDPLPAAVAAGIVQPRAGSTPIAANSSSGLLSFGLDQPLSAAPPSAASALQGVTPDMLAQVQALAAQSQVTPEQLMLAAQQLATASSGGAALGGGMLMHAAGGAASSPGNATGATGWGAVMSTPMSASVAGAVASGATPAGAPGSGFEALDPLAAASPSAGVGSYAGYPSGQATGVLGGGYAGLGVGLPVTPSTPGAAAATGAAAEAAAAQPRDPLDQLGSLVNLGGGGTS